MRVYSINLYFFIRFLTLKILWQRKWSENLEKRINLIIFAPEAMNDSRFTIIGYRLSTIG